MQYATPASATMKDQPHFKGEGEKKPGSKDQPQRRGDVKHSTCTQRMKNKRNPAFLFKWVEEHLNNPYPTDVEKEQLSGQAHMNRRQLDHWFGNERRTIKKIKPPAWLKKHSTLSAYPGIFPLVQRVHDGFPRMPAPPYANSHAVNGINPQLAHLTALPPHMVLPPPPPLTPHVGISSEGGGERGCGPTCTSNDQQAVFSASNGSSVGYQPHHAFYPYPGSMEHPSHGGGTHSAAMVERYTTPPHLTSHTPCSAQTFMIPSSSFNSFTSSSSPQSAYKVVPQVINTSGHSPYAVPTPPQLLDILENGQTDGRLQPYLFIPPLKVKEETWNGASCKLSLYPPSGTAVTNVNGGTREEWGRCVSNAGSGNGKWEVGARGKEGEEHGVKGEELVGAQ